MDQRKSSMPIIKLFLVHFHWLALATLGVAASTDTLKQGDVLNSTSYLVSANRLFTLGFFRPGDLNLGFFRPGDLNNTYLGLWYTSDTDATTVWVANRDTPIYNNSGILSFDDSGKLVITHNRGKPIELYSGQNSSPLAATLLNSGNFVVREENTTDESAKMQPLWQSFDYPTDTLLPHMKLGVNHKTGRNWTLTSWLGQNLPAPGAFTLEWDPRGCRLIIRRRGVIYWTSGALKDKAFEHMAKPDPVNLNFYFINVTTEEEEYFSYSLMVVDQWTPEDRRNLSGWQLGYSGLINDHTRPLIAAVDRCYGYNTPASTPGLEIFSGCELWEQPKCRNDHQIFELRSGGFRTPDGFVLGTFYDNSSLSFSDCRAMCWNDCDCVGFMNSGDTGCSIWRGNKLQFEQDLSGASSSNYLLVSEPLPKKGKKWLKVVIPVVVAVVFLLSGLLWYLRRRTKPQGGKERTEDEDFLELMKPNEGMETNEIENDRKNGHNLEVFSHESIMAATGNFASENKLGEGGFGPVYKGQLPDGREVAVKRLSRKSEQGIIEFKNELILIAKLQHMNLVRMLGCCIHRGAEKMLVYEYMPNKSLDSFLFDGTKKRELPWERRFNIIEGIAQGLLYLHKYSRLKIIHRDLKASNILLDENLNPKISDFGMARIFKQNVTEANTNRIVGTYGYMAPEYAMEGIFSVKSDVFSFGVLMLEIVSGRKNSSFYDIEGPLNLVGYAWELWNNNAAIELMDPTLNGSCIPQQLLRCIHVALLCVEDSVLDRPTMSELVAMLTNDSMVLPIPKRPAFVDRIRVFEDDKQNKSDSVNGLSITAMDPR